MSEAFLEMRWKKNYFFEFKITLISKDEVVVKIEKSILLINDDNKVEDSCK